MSLRHLVWVVAFACFQLAIGAEPVSEKKPEDLAPPAMVRQTTGFIWLDCLAPGAIIRYTLDGSEPGPKAGPYLAPVFLPQGGVLKARVVSADRKTMSAVAQMTFQPLPGSKPRPNTVVPLTQDRDWPIYDFAKRHAALVAQATNKHPELIFIGDSITHMFGGEPHDRSQPGTNVWEKFYGNRNVLNLGFGYDFTENTLWRLLHGELEGAKAKAVVIHIGTNNAGKNTPEEIAVGIHAICDVVHRRLPQARILLMGIFPRGPKPDAMREKLTKINRMLAQLHGENGITYLDIGAKFLQPDGTLSKEVMFDYLHPTEQGYEIWAKAIEPYLAMWLEDSKTEVK
jgi:lysophospholipase L1-like esterase